MEINSHIPKAPIKLNSFFLPTFEKSVLQQAVHAKISMDSPAAINAISSIVISDSHPRYLTASVL